MAVNEFPLPDLGEGLPEAEILKWLVGEGDVVTQNQPIVEVETAKAAVEIPAKWPGRIVRIFHPEGATVRVGAPIVAIDTAATTGEVSLGDGDATDAALADAGAPPAAPASDQSAQPAERTPVLVGCRPRTASVTRDPASWPCGTTAGPAAGGTGTAAASAVDGAGQEVPFAKPPVRKLARDLGVDLRTLVGSGPAGSITRQDVEAAVATPAAPATRNVGCRSKRCPRSTADNVTASAFTAPHVTVFLTVDATRAMRAHRGSPECRSGAMCASRRCCWWRRRCCSPSSDTR